jgi:hypothetical protein
MGTVETKLIDNKNIYIINNFLDHDFFKQLQEIMLSSKINWFYRKTMTNNPLDYSFFSHTFFSKSNIESDFYLNYILPIVDKLGFESLIEARANLLVNRGTVYQSYFHIDRKYPCRTALLYINTCNGYTVFDKKENFISKCEENKMVVFDSGIEHSSVAQTDTDQRVVINFNGF